MADKPDKFRVKLWLAIDASSKYLLNGFPYLGKDVHRPSNQPVSEYIVLQLMDMAISWEGTQCDYRQLLHVGEISRKTRVEEDELSN